MVRLRVAFKLIALVVVTGVSALPPALVRRLCFGALRPSAWVGARACQFWGWGLCHIMGIRRSVRGRPQGRVFVVAANHVSYLDILVLSSIYPSVFVAKKEIAGWPLFGWITRNCGTLFIDRGRPRDVVRAGHAMREHLRNSIPLTLFPEGQATCGAEVLPFLPSLLEPMAQENAPCYAVSLSYEAADSVEPPSKTLCWWGGVEFLPHLRRVLSFRQIEARVHFSAQPIQSRTRKELARRLRDEVKKNFVPMRQTPLGVDAGESDHSRDSSQTSAPMKSHGSRPSSQRSGSGENVTSVK